MLLRGHAVIFSALGQCQKTPSVVKYQIVIAPLALKMLQGIPDNRIRKSIRDRIDQLGVDPEKQEAPG